MESVKAWYSTGIVVTSPLDHWAIKRETRQLEGKRQKFEWWTNQNFVKIKISKDFQKKNVGGRVEKTVVCVWVEMGWLRQEVDEDGCVV